MRRQNSVIWVVRVAKSNAAKHWLLHCAKPLIGLQDSLVISISQPKGVLPTSQELCWPLPPQAEEGTITHPDSWEKWAKLDSSREVWVKSLTWIHVYGTMKKESHEAGGGGGGRESAKILVNVILVGQSQGAIWKWPCLQGRWGVDDSHVTSDK